MVVENFQFDKCRGLESRVMDGNSDITVIKAPVNKVSETVIQLNSKAKLHAEALERVIQAQDRGIVLLQFRGLDWTIVYHHRRTLLSGEVELSQISKILHTRVMTLVITDTAFYIYHEVWENGESVEYFLFDDEIIKLESRIRQVSETCVDHDSLNEFYSEQGVYFPYVRIISELSEQDNRSLLTFKARGEFARCLSKQFKNLSSEDCLKSYPLERSDFEGFDYITFED